MCLFWRWFCLQLSFSIFMRGLNWESGFDGTNKRVWNNILISRCILCSCLNGFIIISRNNLVISPHNPLSNFTSSKNRFPVFSISMYVSFSKSPKSYISLHFFFIVQLIVTWRICFRIMRTLKSVACSGIWYSAQFTRTF